MRGWTVRLRAGIRRILRAAGTPEEIGRGVAAGFAVAPWPLPGLQIPLSILLATLVRGNRVVSVIPQAISNPVTMLPLALLQYRLGTWLLPWREETAEARGRLSALKEAFESFTWTDFAASVRRFYGTLADIGADVGIPLLAGTAFCSIVGAAAGYFVTVRAVRAYRAGRAARAPVAGAGGAAEMTGGGPAPAGAVTEGAAAEAGSAGIGTAAPAGPSAGVVTPAAAVAPIAPAGPSCGHPGTAHCAADGSGGPANGGGADKADLSSACRTSLSPPGPQEMLEPRDRPASYGSAGAAQPQAAATERESGSDWRDDAVRLALQPGRFLTGNRVRLLRDGRETYPAMLDAISKARVSVRLETYTLADDFVGRRFADALALAARKRLDVRLLCDAIGSAGLTEGFLRELASSGVRTAMFHPVATWRKGWPLNKRDHRKILVVDGAAGFIGGLNISREYAPEEEGGEGWRDTHLEIRGPAAGALE
ncbi:MAG: DUF2062 domain-containing protein, partial [Planctomycetota bacterium]|nr:DUF2062 domain-containing protein [Planctomycetota bacterium]